MKKEVSVEQLEFGVYVAELDRPWTETPFMFQGFVLNRKQLDALKKYCKKVFIDPEKGADVPTRASRTLRSPAPPTAPKPPSVLTTIKDQGHLRGKAPVDVELPVARAATRKTAIVLKDMFRSVQAGKALDAPRVKEAVTNMTDSVVRNPDAMLLLAKMKEKSEHTLDRALGVSIYMITFGRFLSAAARAARSARHARAAAGRRKDALPAELLNKKETLSEAEMACARATSGTRSRS